MRQIRIDDKFNPVTLGEFYDSPNDDCRLIILTSRDVTVLRKALTPMYWPTRFGEYISPTLFRVWDNGELLELLENLEVKLMGCDIGLQIKEGLEAVANGLFAIANKPCCNDNTSVIIEVNGGVNGSLEGGGITYGTQPYGDDPVTLPDGYESEEQYRVQKCAMATAMADGIIAMLYGLDGIATFNAIAGTTLTVLGLIGIIVIPEVMIPALIAAISIAWLASGSLYAAASAVEENKEDLVCILYTTDTPSVAISLVADFFDTILAGLSFSAPVASAIKTIFMLAVNADTLEKLYSEYAGFNYPAADCSNCLPSFAAGLNGAMAHRYEWDGTEYGAVVTGGSNVAGEPDGLNGEFSGSYYLDVAIGMGGAIADGWNVDLIGSFEHTADFWIYVNSNPSAVYTSSGWVLQSTNDQSFVATQSFSAILIKSYGAEGYDSKQIIDAVQCYAP